MGTKKDETAPGAPPEAETTGAAALAKVSSPAGGAQTKTKLWTVFDLNATEQKRIHHVGGVGYALSADEGTQMDRAAALVFLGDPSFRVVDPSGEVATPTPKIRVNEATGGVMLQPGQVVATYSELVTSALEARAVRLPGGMQAVEQGRDAMIELLTTWREAVGSDKPLKADVEALSDSATAALLARGGSTAAMLAR